MKYRHPRKGITYAPARRVAMWETPIPVVEREGHPDEVAFGDQFIWRKISDALEPLSATSPDYRIRVTIEIVPPE